MSLRYYEQGGGHMVDSNRLTTEQRAELARLLPKRLGSGKVERFLVQVSEAVDTWENITEDGASESVMVLQLDQVQNDVRRLANSLNRLDRLTLDTVAGHFDALVWCTQPEVDLPPDLLHDKPPFAEWLREQVQCMRNLAAVMQYAQGKITPTNVSRSKRQARDLVRLVAWAHQGVFGNPPPKSTWFYGFMAELGSLIEVSLGKDLVNSTLSDTQF